MKKVQIPIAYCPICEMDSPVVIRDIAPDEWSGEGITKAMTLIYCPGCEQIINSIGDIEIKWYTPEELSKATGWQVAER